MSWHDVLKENIGSNHEAAVRMFRDWKKQAGQKAVGRTTVKALANKLGQLRAGGDSTGWWHERPVLRQILADLLELDVDAIFGRPTPTKLAFREFPALPPLGGGEAPFRTTRTGSVFERALEMARQEHRRVWLVVPPGGGKSLAIELLRERHADEVVARTFVHLNEAVELARSAAIGRPLVVEVEERRAAEDLAAVDALSSHRSSVVVLSPFVCPKDQRDPEWTSLRVDLDSDWVGRMLAWVEARLQSSPSDTKLDPKDVETWLDRNPSLRRSIRSPGDLLALCSDFHLYGSEGTPQERAERWLRTVGVGALPEDTPRSWRNYGAATCIHQMIEMDGLDVSVALHERAFSSWAALVPPGHVDGAESGADRIVGYLRAAGLLRTSGDGLTPFPHWVGEALVQPRVGELVRGGRVAEWGAVAGDRSRQHLVDGTLDTLPTSELRVAGGPLLLGRKGRTFAEVAALDALVAAFGRRLSSHDARRDERDADFARRAVVRQWQYLIGVQGVGYGRTPLTRRDRDEWLVVGWSISLASGPPRAKVPRDLRWVFPAWVPDLSLSELTAGSLPSSSMQPWDASPAVEELMALSSAVVASLSPGHVPRGSPRLLLPALFLAGNWTLAHEHLGDLAGTWEEAVLAGRASGLESEQRRVLATSFWQFADDAQSDGVPLVRGGTEGPSMPIAARIKYLQHRHPHLLPFVLENLPVETVEDSGRRGGTHRRLFGSHAPSSVQALRRLSIEQRAAAVRGRLSNPIEFSEVRELVEVLDGGDLDLLLDVVRAADRDVAAEFAVRTWRILPARATVEAREALENGLASAEAWFRTAPRSSLGALVRAVEQTVPRPSWVEEWAREKVVDAGTFAETLYRLMRAESPRRTRTARRAQKA